MKRLHVFNPVAGHGHSPELIKRASDKGEDTYVTKGVGDIERCVYERCNECESTHFIVYGGDGSVNEAVNGIMEKVFIYFSKEACETLGQAQCEATEVGGQPAVNRD